MAPTRPTGRGGGARPTVSTPGTRATRPTGRGVRATPTDHGRSRGFFGSLAHDITHPGLSEFIAATNPVYLPFYLAGHTHNKAVRAVGHVGQALTGAPQMLVAHPKGTAKNLGQLATAPIEAIGGLSQPYVNALRGMAPPMLGGPSGTSPSGLTRFNVPGGRTVKTYGSITKRLEQATKQNVTVLRKSIVKDYKTRYGEDWKSAAAKDPLWNFTDLLMVLGPATRGVAAARAFSELRTADGLAEFGGRDFAQLSKGEKVRAMRAEIAQPGSAIEGQVRPRRISYQPHPEEPAISATLPPSRSPLRRGVQDLNDKLSQAFPHIPLTGARSRVNRANSVKIGRDIQRAYGGLEGADSLARLPREALMRLWAEGQMMQRPAHLIGESANLPEHAADLAAHHELASGEVQRVRDALAQEYSHSPAKDAVLPDWVRHAVKQGFGKEVLAGFDAAIKHKPNADYNRAYGYLHGASNLARQVNLDSHGFSALKNDLIRAHDRVDQYEQLQQEGNLVRPEKLAQAHDDVSRLELSLRDAVDATDEMMKQRQARPRMFVDALTKPFPEREAWIKDWQRRGAPQDKIDAIMAITNEKAMSSPGGPEAYWRDRVGFPAGQDSALRFVAGRPAAMFQDFPIAGRTKLIEGDALAPAETSAYHSRTQKQVMEGWGPKAERQMGGVRKQIKEAVSLSEWENLELDNFFNQFDKNEMITQAQLQRHLSIPLNRYNIQETHLTNAVTGGWGPRWGAGAYQTEIGSFWRDELLSRHGDPGQYHEIYFDLPEGTIHPSDYRGKGAEHWKAPNVTGHVRFQVFTENGAKKLLIEEVQSDWARQFTTQTKFGLEYGTRTDEWNLRVRQLREEKALAQRRYDQANLNWRRVQQVTDDVRLQLKNAKERGDDADAGYLQVQLKSMEEIHAPQKAEHDAALKEFGQADLALDKHMANRKGSVPPPPLTNKEAQRLGVHRLLRYAAENGIDEVILTDGTTQNARNLVTAEGRSLHEGEQLWHHDLLVAGEEGAPRTPELARSLAENEFHTSTHFHRIYEKEIPAVIEKRLGIKGEMTDDAYQGFIGTQAGIRTETGSMRGTVFKLDDAAKAKAVEGDFLYQRQPDWPKLPKGATEFLAGGKTRIHMFKDADISTWMHELFHVSMPDLEGEHRATLENYYGEGKPMDEWDNAAHENAARDFERYLREGKIPNKILAGAFEAISRWMRELFVRAKDEGQPLPKEVEDAFAAIFPEPVARDGEIPDFFIPHRARTADLGGKAGSKGIPRAPRDIGDWVPHNAKEQLFARNNLLLMRSGLINPDPRLLVDHVNRLVMLQRANSIREFLLEHASPLLPHETADLSTHYVIKKSGTTIKKQLYDALEVAHNPDELRAAMKDLVESNIEDKQTAIDAWKQDEAKGLASGRAGQLYTIDKKMTDDLFKNLTGKTPGATTTPAGTTGKVIDSALDTWRGLLLYGNPGFYTANILGNTYMMAMSDPRALQYLVWSMKNASKAAAGHGHVDHLWNRIAVEMGRGPTTGSFSRRERYLGGPLDETMTSGNIVRRQARKTRAQIRHISNPKRGETRTRLLAEGTSHLWGTVGHHAGALVDDTFRVPAWRQTASKHGFKTEAQINDLLDTARAPLEGEGKVTREAKEAAQRQLHGIRDEAEQLMLDFDSSTPMEKTVLSRFIFLYPFVRASVKYPAMFAGERPFTTGLIGTAGALGGQVADETLGPRPEGLPAWTDAYARFGGGYIPGGSFSPYQSFADTIKTVASLGRPAPLGTNDPFGIIPPLFQMAADLARNQNQYGRDEAWNKIIREDMALPSWMTQAMRMRQPSPVYTDRSLWDTILRSTRVVPFGIQAPPGG